MTEEPIREGEWSEDPEKEEWEESSKGVKNRVKSAWSQFAPRGIFLFFVFFVVGVLFGFSAKMLAVRNITIGYWDYTVSPKEISAININAVQQKILKNQAEEAKEQEEALKKAEEKKADDSNESLAPEPSETPQEK